MSDELIPFPHTNGANGSAQVRVVPYPARARVVVEHDDHPLDAWDQIVRLVPRVEGLLDLIRSLGILVDEQDQTPPDEWIESYWRMVAELITARQDIDVAALKRTYGPGAPLIERYDDKLDDEIAVAQQELDWLIPVLEEIAATVDLIQRHLREHQRDDAAEAIGELIGVTDLEESRLSFGELFRLWQSYRLDAQGNLQRVARGLILPSRWGHEAVLRGLAVAGGDRRRGRDAASGGGARLPGVDPDHQAVAAASARGGGSRSQARARPAGGQARCAAGGAAGPSGRARRRDAGGAVRLVAGGVRGPGEHGDDESGDLGVGDDAKKN
jgi:hypothetical protein